MPVLRENCASRMEIDSSPHDVCRLCAESYVSRSFIPLYTSDKREQIIAKQINQLVVNLISPDDGLPQKICLKCAKNVEMCYSFVCDVIETQNKLKRLKCAAVAEDQKLKCASDDEFVQNCRWENVTLNDYDNGLNTDRRSISKSSVYPTKTKTIDDTQQCERSVTTRSTRSLSSTTSTTTATARFSFRQSRSQSQLQSQIQLQTEIVAVTGPKTISPCCRYRCGVCLKKNSAKDDCIRHMISSHTPSSSVSSLKNTRNLVGFDVVRENYDGHDNCGGDDASSNNACNSNNNYYKSKRQMPVSPTSFSSSLKSHKKILLIDSFYREIKENCARHECDLSGRLMISWFAFKRHLRKHHRKAKTASKVVTNHVRTLMKSSTVGTVMAKPSISYCKTCNEAVKHSRRHNMYHAIVNLELDYPNFMKFLSV